ncbi:Uncharacterised protein [Vibrio cholerae]|nr:Uncharacterised protein [Vibrio cholerae]
MSSESLASNCMAASIFCKSLDSPSIIAIFSSTTLRPCIAACSASSEASAARPALCATSCTVAVN